MTSDPVPASPARDDPVSELTRRADDIVKELDDVVKQMADLLRRRTDDPA